MPLLRHQKVVTNHTQTKPKVKVVVASKPNSILMVIKWWYHFIRVIVIVFIVWTICTFGFWMLDRGMDSGTKKPFLEYYRGQLDWAKDIWHHIS